MAGSASATRALEAEAGGRHWRGCGCRDHEVKHTLRDTVHQKGERQDSRLRCGGRGLWALGLLAGSGDGMQIAQSAEDFLAGQQPVVVVVNAVQRSCHICGPCGPGTRHRTYLEAHGKVSHGPIEVPAPWASGGQQGKYRLGSIRPSYLPDAVLGFVNIAVRACGAGDWGRATGA